MYVDDVVAAGGDPVPGAGDPLAVLPVGPEPVLRFADAGRPSPGEEWTLHARPIGDPATVAADVAGPSPAAA